MEFSSLVEHIEPAEVRAAAQLERRNAEALAFGRPSTTVGALTKEIRLAATRAQP